MLRNDATVVKLRPTLERVLGVLEASVGTSVAAAERLKATVKRLRAFARLDEAELQATDLRADLDDVLNLVPSETVGKARVERHYAALPQVPRPPRPRS